MLSGNEIRAAFLAFFEARGHYIHPGISLIPTDPSLFLTAAGVVPFRGIIEGREKPEHPRVANCQRCVRTNDIENVGKTTRHCTFFEMMGNWSFGDYYKRESLTWGMEFVLDVLRLDKNRIWGTVYAEGDKVDQESLDIWTQGLGIPRDRIVLLEDNFWGPVAETGACGPDSEFQYDLGPQFCTCSTDKSGCTPARQNCDRWLEIWNHVFTDLYKNSDGSFSPLPKKNIDTGSGLERLTMAHQGVSSIYETDLLSPLVQKAVEIISKAVPGTSTNLASDWRTRLIAEHARTITFLISDGILPSNEGRGYVLRRVLRRAARYGRLLGVPHTFLKDLVEVVVRNFGGYYPQLVQQRDHLERIVEAEEERFFEALTMGTTQLERMLDATPSKLLAGNDAFILYDTYGFPVELTEEILAERGFQLDKEGFKLAMERQRARARADRALRADEEEHIDPSLLAGASETKFLGYELLQAGSRITKLFCEGQEARVLKDGQLGLMVTPETPFYAESGGQVGDSGQVKSPDFRGRIVDTKKVGQVWLHLLEVEEGEAAPGCVVDLLVDSRRRQAIQRAHSATHILHWALRSILGSHVTQAGSVVEPDRLRFDFSHFQATSPDELRLIEDLCYEKILANDPVRWSYMPLAEAKAKGAMALFGEKYGSEVRVVETGDYSLELCGGTHVKATGEIGAFVFAYEGSVGAGHRRVEVLTGAAVLQRLRDYDALIHEAAHMLGTTKPDEIVLAAERYSARTRALEKELERLQSKQAGSQADALAASFQPLNGIKVLVSEVSAPTLDVQKNLVDQLLAKAGEGAVLTLAKVDGKLTLVGKASSKAVAKGVHVGRILAEAAKIAGGGGGGRPDFAQAGARDTSKIAEALAAARKLLLEALS